MTVSSEINKSGPYIGNGVTTVFDYDFKIVDEAHLNVIKTNTTTLVETILVLDTNYTVADVGNPSGGQITTLVAPSSGETITILLNVPFTQETDLENQGAYYAETVEAALDLAAQRDLQLKEEISRAVQIPASSDPSGLPDLIRDIIRLGASADNIDIVATNIDAVNEVADNMPDVVTVSGAVDEIKAIGAEVEQDQQSAAASAAAAAQSALEAAQQVANVVPSIKRFSGDAIETEFDLETGEIDENMTTVFISGVYQQKDTYSVVDGILTFSAAPPAGSGNIEVVIAGTVALTPPAKLGMWTQAGAGAVPRTIDGRLKDVVSIKDFGAVGDGVTNDDAAFDLAEAHSAKAIYLPPGTYLTSRSAYELISKRYYGEGQIKLDGYRQAKNRSFITSQQPAPSDDRTRVFDGGFDKAHSISYSFVGSGANPSVLPDLYTNYLEWNARVHIHDFTAGFNKDPADHALGRSGAFVDTIRMYHGGQGDLVARNFFGVGYSTRSGATHWLSCPAVVVENGNLGVEPGTGCVYLNHSEYVYSDNNNDANVVDRVRNYHRENDTGALNQVWIHDRPQSVGPKRINAFYSPSGPSRNGIDFGCADLLGGAAVVLAANQRIYYDAVATADALGVKMYSQNVGQVFTEYDGPDSRWKLVVHNQPVIAASDSDIWFPKPITFVPGTGGGPLFVNGQVSFALLSNTQFVILAKGSDGVVRAGSVTLA